MPLSANQVLKYNGSNWTNSSVDITELSSTSIVSPVNKNVLKYNGTNWTNSSVDITELTSTSINTPSSNQVLKYNGSNWINSSVNITELSGTNISTPSSNQVVKYNGTNWINSNVNISELSGTSIVSPVNKNVLKYNGTNWINSSVTIPDITGFSITSPSNSQVLQYNGTNWVNSTLSVGGLTTDSSTTSLNLNSFSSNTFTNYTSSSITLTAGPAAVTSPVTTSLAVQFETDGTFFNQRLYVSGVAYTRNGSLSNIMNVPWVSTYSTQSSSNRSVIDALSTPPSYAVEGDIYYILSSPTGNWSGFTVGTLAYYFNSAWVNVSISNGTVVVLLSPDNLSSLSSGYYYSGQTCVYNSLFTPVVSSVYLQPVTAQSTTVPSVNDLVVKSVVPYSHPNTYSNPIVNLNYIVLIDSQDRAWFKRCAVLTTALDHPLYNGNDNPYFAGLTMKTFIA